MFNLRLFYLNKIENGYVLITRNVSIIQNVSSNLGDYIYS